MRNTKTHGVISNRILVLLALLLFGATTITAAPGDLDPTFGDGGIADALSGGSPYQLYSANAMAIQPDGKIVVVGQGVGPSHGGNWEAAIVRFNMGGSLDTSFGGTGIVINPISLWGFSAIAIQPDGKIVVVCVGGAIGTFGVVRYNPNGSLDTTFNGSGTVLTPVFSSGGPNSVTIQPDGKIVVIGWGSSQNGLTAIVRYNPNGSLDTSFNGSGIVFTPDFAASSVVSQVDGKIIAAGYGVGSFGSGKFLVRYNADGSQDTTFNGSGSVTTTVGDAFSVVDLAIQSDGKIVVVGALGVYSVDFAVARYNADGSFDSSFGGTGKILLPGGVYARSVAIQTNGQIVVGRIDNAGDFAVVRLNPNGSTDTSFNSRGTILKGGLEGGYVAIQADGKIVIAGDFGPDEFKSFVAVRYQGDGVTPLATPTPTPTPMATPTPAGPGDLDPTFGNGGKFVDGDGNYTPFDLALQSDGKIVVVGNRVGDFVVARYNANGSPDLTFGSGTGRVITDLGGEEFAWGVVVQPDGKIVAGGVSTIPGASFFIARYNSDGSFDTGFGGGTGKVLTALPCGSSSDNYGADFTIQPDGKLVGAVKFEYCLGQLIRYLPDGSLDVSFGSQGFVTLAGTTSSSTSVLVQPNGKVIWGFEYSGIYRYEPNGSPDLSFGSGGHVSFPSPDLKSVNIQPDGKIVALGVYLNSSALVRYNIDGSLDVSFGFNGLATAGSVRLLAAAIQRDGKILAAGSSLDINGTGDFSLIRYNTDGSLDGTFGGGDGITTVDFNNSSDAAIGVALDSQGRAVLVGNSNNMLAIARVFTDARSNSCSSANPIDCAEFFVRQHYLDFLSREPEQAGFQEWMNVLNSCNGDLSCLYGPDGKRTLVSLSFFGSQEFNLKGGYVFRFYKATLGRMPTYVEMEEAMRSVTGATADEVFQKRATFAANWVLRDDFLDAFPRTLSPADFVNKIEMTAGITLASRNQIINDLTVANNTDAARAAALRAIVDSNEEQNKELNASFVYMQYVGYLRRDPDPNGYNSWLTYLNDHPGDFKTMVWGFVDSIEYRKRFGQP